MLSPRLLTTPELLLSDARLVLSSLPISLMVCVIGAIHWPWNSSLVRGLDYEGGRLHMSTLRISNHTTGGAYFYFFVAVEHTIKTKLISSKMFM